MVSTQLQDELHSYILDTSSIMAIPHLYPQTKERIWDGILQLINNDRLKTIEIVLEELERNIEYANGSLDRLDQFRDKLLIPWSPLLLRAGEIAGQFPRISPHNNPRIKADPLVIAAAERDELTVVCDESRGSRRRNMHVACRELRVRCRILGDFVRDENLG